MSHLEFDTDLGFRAKEACGLHPEQQKDFVNLTTGLVCQGEVLQTSHVHDDVIPEVHRPICEVWIEPRIHNVGTQLQGFDSCKYRSIDRPELGVVAFMDIVVSVAQDSEAVHLVGILLSFSVDGFAGSQ